MIFVNKVTGNFRRVYVGYDDQFVLQIYNSIDVKGKPQEWIAEVPLSNLAASLETQLSAVIIDTIKSSTEFLILE